MGVLKSQKESNKNRNEAIRLGLKIYTGKPCKNCSDTKKRVDSYGCVTCSNKRGLLNSKTTNGKKWAFKSRIMFKYKLSLDDYNKMYTEQNGKCAICNNPETRGRYKKLYIDHSHVTGKVRSLLCHRCNSILGFTNESIATLQKIIQYIQTHNN